MDSTILGVILVLYMAKRQVCKIIRVIHIISDYFVIYHANIISYLFLHVYKVWPSVPSVTFPEGSGRRSHIFIQDSISPWLNNPSVNKEEIKRAHKFLQSIHWLISNINSPIMTLTLFASVKTTHGYLHTGTIFLISVHDVRSEHLRDGGSIYISTRSTAFDNVLVGRLQGEPFWFFFGQAYLLHSQFFTKNQGKSTRKPWEDHERISPVSTGTSIHLLAAKFLVRSGLDW